MWRCCRINAGKRRIHSHLHNCIIKWKTEGITCLTLHNQTVEIIHLNSFLTEKWNMVKSLKVKVNSENTVSRVKTELDDSVLMMQQWPYQRIHVAHVYPPTELTASLQFTHVTCVGSWLIHGEYLVGVMLEWSEEIVHCDFINIPAGMQLVETTIWMSEQHLCVWSSKLLTFCWFNLCCSASTRTEIQRLMHANTRITLWSWMSQCRLDGGVNDVQTISNKSPLTPGACWVKVSSFPVSVIHY